MAHTPENIPSKEQVRNHIRQGRMQQAMDACRLLCAHDPRDAESWFLLGTICGVLGDYEEAETCLLRAVAIVPNVGMAFYNLGIARMHRGKAGEAAACFRRALELDPRWPAAHCDLGNALKVLSQYDAAMKSYEQAIALDASYADAYHALGTVYHDRGMIGPAKEAYRKAIDINVGRGMPVDGARIRLATVLPVILSSVTEMEAARDSLERDLDGILRQPARVLQPDKEIAASNFLLAYHGRNDRDLQGKLARAHLHASPGLAYEAPFCRNYRAPAAGERRIRIGFISRYFKNHSIGKTSSGIIARMSREQFETYTFVFEPPHDELSRFIAEHSEHVIQLTTHLEDARRRIAALELDILFYQDIGMDFFTYFLAFSRLAPVQCTSFGHPETTGIPNIDYYISTDCWETEGAQAHYSERLVRLKNVASVALYAEPKLPPKWKPRSAFGLPDEATLYICPQSLFKVHPDFDALLAGILRRDPSGRAVFIESVHPHWGELLRARFRNGMGGLSERVDFVPKQPHEDYLNLMAVSDVVLDTIHFCGFNTSLEAFAVGKPVVTLPGDLMRSRHTMCFYRKMDVPDCVAGDPDEYVSIAVRLGTDGEFRRSVVARISERRHVLWEEMEVVREFERFFSKAVQGGPEA